MPLSQGIVQRGLLVVCLAVALGLTSNSLTHSAAAAAARTSIATQTRLVKPAGARFAGGGVAWLGSFSGVGSDAVAVEGYAVGNGGSGVDWAGGQSWQPGSSVSLGASLGVQLVGVRVADTDAKAGFPVDMRFGAVAGIGDFNGDGIDDALLDRCVVLGSGTRGRSLRLPTISPDVPACAPMGASQPSHYASGAGDLDGDGLDDAVVTLANGSAGVQNAYVFFGHRSGEPQRTLTVASGARRASAVAGVGDVTGDGHDDLGFTTGTGVLVVPGPFQGGTLRLDSPPAGSFMAVRSPAPSYIDDVQALGDVDGDGIDDIGVAYRAVDIGPSLTPQTDVSQIIYGAPAGHTNAITRVRWPGQAANVGPVVGAGDLDADGLRDVVVAVSGEQQADVIFGRRDRPRTILLHQLKSRDGYRVRPTRRVPGFGLAVGSAPPWIGAHTSGVLVSGGHYGTTVVTDTDPAAIARDARATAGGLKVLVRCPNAARVRCATRVTATGPRCARYSATRRLPAGTLDNVVLRATQRATRGRCVSRAHATLRSPYRTWVISQAIRTSRR